MDEQILVTQLIKHTHRRMCILTIIILVNSLVIAAKLIIVIDLRQQSIDINHI